MECPLCKGTGEVKMGFEARTPTEIGNVLSEAREDKGLSLRHVAKMTGISNAALSQVETGKIKSPSFHTVAKLCDVYGIKIGSLIKEGK